MVDLFDAGFPGCPGEEVARMSVCVTFTDKIKNYLFAEWFSGFRKYFSDGCESIFIV